MFQNNPIIEGSTCYISRIKKHSKNPMEINFSTLHSLVYKVLRRTSTYRDNKQALLDQFSGPQMHSYVEGALTLLNGQIPSEDQISMFYYRLREHENYGLNINTWEQGESFFSHYQSIKGNRMDWEESLQLATWYLNNEIVHSIEDFNFENIILLNPELLQDPSNKNASDFFEALCRWSLFHTTWNIYVETPEGIYPYVINRPEPTDYQSALLY